MGSLVLPELRRRLASPPPKGNRIGITVTKKIGNAVVRNRMKRRFRELLRAHLPEQGLPDHDHVLIGRAGGVERDFHVMADELAKALARARDGKGDPAGGRRPAAPAPVCLPSPVLPSPLLPWRIQECRFPCPSSHCLLTCRRG